ncbi:hypothetical protein TNCV_794531 [Trichonephila clavipes]|nr:hypothetical protein TNCV_794531 [Trichonephila clavipes]
MEEVFNNRGFLTLQNAPNRQTERVSFKEGCRLVNLLLTTSERAKRSMVIGIEPITNFLIPQLNNHDVQELWFQQDNNMSTQLVATNDLLKTRLVTANFTFWTCELASRSCDLTPLDAVFCGAM